MDFDPLAGFFDGAFGAELDYLIVELDEVFGLFIWVVLAEGVEMVGRLLVLLIADLTQY